MDLTYFVKISSLSVFSVRDPV